MTAGPARWLAAASLLALLTGGPAQAATFRIDETGTVVSDPVLRMQWREALPGRSGDRTVTGVLRVDVRLNLQPWLNRQSRIYLVLAPTSGARLQAQWTTQGRLQPGTLRSGERALVYEGPAGPATLTDSLRMQVEADGRTLDGLQRLDFHFEIEVNP